MARLAGFSPRDWDMAPTYISPTNAPGVMALDFDVLGAIARQEQANGAFRATEDGTLAKAPLFVDDLPGALYWVDTSFPQFTPKHNTTARETLVVVRGVLKLALNDEVHEDDDGGNLRNVFLPGQVVELEERAISMQAVGLVDPASCLALALYRDHDVDTRAIHILG